jgi:hypothetical protein
MSENETSDRQQVSITMEETSDRQQVSITMEVEPGTDMDVIVSRLIDAVEDMSGVLAAWES